MKQCAAVVLSWLLCVAAFGDEEMVMKVRVKRPRAFDASTSTSAARLSKEEINDLPQGQQITLPQLIASTTPGVLKGTFGQLYFRGNHGNIQYQIDGVQLPDSPSNAFGESFSPRNIDHMEVITGGIPAEYGQRLSAVINIVSKTGAEKTGGSAELNYGTYNYFSPTATVGGSTSEGSLHYYLSGNFRRTDRGLDTPQPLSNTDVTRGGADYVHDVSKAHNEFIKLDWLASNENSFSFIVFNSVTNVQIPTYPLSFQPGDALFTAGDSFGNHPYNYLPSATDDRQFEESTYVIGTWKHTFDSKLFFRLSPYWKYSYLGVTNDPANDLLGATAVPGGTNTYSSFSQSRHVNNGGLKGDLTWRPSESHLVKTGFQIQAAAARGSLNIQTAQNGQPNQFFSDSTPNDSLQASLYVQDDYTIVKPLTLNAGLRADGYKLNLGPGATPTDGAIQPRVGLSYVASESTKLHVFYGKLFQPAPVENLRFAFTTVGGGQGGSYDIKPEKADYIEGGVVQVLPFNHAISVTAYGKSVENLIDEAQLLNTSIAQPFNFAKGYVYGAEVAIRGQLTDEISDYVNYGYNVGKGKGISGGVFVFQPGQEPSGGYQFLDHHQFHTLNAGLTYRKQYCWGTIQALYGSGLHTGPGNSLTLPGHLTFDATVGYELHGSEWWNSGVKLSLDVLNITNNRYPITVANGFNGSHYAAGRQIIVHLSKEL